MEVANLIEIIKKQYGYEVDPVEADFLWDSAKLLYLQLRYPFDMTISEVPEKEKARAEMLIVKLVFDYLERKGLTSAVSYHENGITQTFDGAGVSRYLKKMIVPTASVIR